MRVKNNARYESGRCATPGRGWNDICFFFFFFFVVGITWCFEVVLFDGCFVFPREFFMNKTDGNISCCGMCIINSKGMF